MIRYITFLLLLLCVGCRVDNVLDSYSPEKPAKVGFSIQLNNEMQRIIADSIGLQLISRLLAYSNERRDFVLEKEISRADYVINIRIKDLSVVSRKKQNEMGKRRKQIERKYDVINDSLAVNYKPKSAGELVAANIAANFISGALFGPGWFVNVITNDGPQTAEIGWGDQKLLAATNTESHLLSEFEVIDKSRNAIILKKKNNQKLNMNYPMSENEQLYVLARNFVLKMDENVPFLRLRTR
jgi:hypothetical protein